MTARNSVSITAPAASRDDANKLMEALGYGPNTFSVELSPNGRGTPTHYGCHWWMDDETLAELTGVKARLLPSEKDATGTGLTMKRAQDAGAAIVSGDQVGGRPRDGFAKELIKQSLQRIEQQDLIAPVRGGGGGGGASRRLQHA